MNRLLTSLVLKVSLVPSEVSGWKEPAEAPQHSLIYCVRQKAALLHVVSAAPVVYTHMHRSEITSDVDAYLPGGTFFTLARSSDPMTQRFRHVLPNRCSL